MVTRCGKPSRETSKTTNGSSETIVTERIYVLTLSHNPQTTIVYSRITSKTLITQLYKNIVRHNRKKEYGLCKTFNIQRTVIIIFKNRS